MIPREKCLELAKESFVAPIRGRVGDDFMDVSWWSIEDLINRAYQEGQKAPQPVGLEPDYEVWKSTDSCNEFYSWERCDKAEYDKTEDDRRRVIYSAEQVARLQQELDTERMRLAACGVVALANTLESAAKQRQMKPEYRSASLDDVERIVNSEMSLRKQRDELLAVLKQYDKLTSHDGWYADLELAALSPDPLLKSER